ncbi:DNA translocase FtsK [Duganella callida]|nr:DNA translocase FtsK [Duganella callida]
MEASGNQAEPGQQQVERAIKLTSEMYNVRDMHRAVLDTLYEQTLKPYIDTVRESMQQTGADEIQTALTLAKQHTGGAQTAQMFLVAAIEMVEPSPRPAKGDEPVREQRVVGAATDVPAGDGSATDPLYDQAVAVVRTNQRASVSLIQRHLLIGYNRAARLLEAMEGSVVGPAGSNGSREILA